MKPDTVAQIILWQGIEDYSGLWEILWELNSRYPGEPELERLQVAASVMEDLVSNGLVRLHRCQEPYGELTEIENSEQVAVLRDSINWRDPLPNTVSVRFETTQEGATFYNKE